MHVYVHRVNIHAYTYIDLDLDKQMINIYYNDYRSSHAMEGTSQAIYI